MRNALWTLGLGAVLILYGVLATAGEEVKPKADPKADPTDAAKLSVDVPAQPAQTIVWRVEVVQVVYNLESRPAVVDDKGEVLEPAIRAGQLRSVYVKWRAAGGRRQDQRAITVADCKELLKQVRLGK